MADIEHSTLTGSELHEPKGIATATSDEIYIADGAASGAWKEVYIQGWEDYNHGGGSQSPAAATWTDLLNDGAGPNTNTAYGIPGYSTLWDTTNNEFNWSSAGLSLGDIVDIRFDVTVTTANPNEVFRLRLDLAHGDPAEYTLPFIDESVKTASTQQFVYSIPVYMGDTETLNNPAKIAIRFDGAGNSVQVNGWFTRYIPYRPVFV